MSCSWLPSPETWAGDREVIDRFVIHRELEAFRNEIFWKGLARYRQSANEMARLPILDVPRGGLLPNRAAIRPRPTRSSGYPHRLKLSPRRRVGVVLSSRISTIPQTRSSLFMTRRYWWKIRPALRIPPSYFTLECIVVLLHELFAVRWTFYRGRIRSLFHTEIYLGLARALYFLLLVFSRRIFYNA